MSADGPFSGLPGSDAEFMRYLAGAGSGRRWEAVVDSFSCRQMYLRSYQFSTAKEESLQEKTRRCLEKAKNRAGSALRALPLRRRRRRLRIARLGEEKKTTINVKRCAEAVGRVSLSAIRSFFRRLLPSAASKDVAGGRSLWPRRRV